MHGLPLLVAQGKSSKAEVLCLSASMMLTAAMQESIEEWGRHLKNL
jgi:hypothetical protein